ncbi:MAG: hypothetical protein Q4G07_01090 [Oscillospiraceae bacterium]|nr:hypothetical protein [Oscillospiraceae bacterium]
MPQKFWPTVAALSPPPEKAFSPFPAGFNGPALVKIKPPAQKRITAAEIFFSHGQTQSALQRPIRLQTAKAYGAPFLCDPFCLSRVRRPRLREFPIYNEGRNVPRKPPGFFYGPLGRKSLTWPTPRLKIFPVTHPQKGKAL